MLCCGEKVRFTKDELAIIRKVCGSFYVEPRTVGQYNQMVIQARDALRAAGEYTRANSLDAMILQERAGIDNAAAAAPAFKEAS